MPELLLTRVLKTGCVGKDVEGATRAMLRYLDDDAGWKAFVAALPIVRRTWGPGKTRLAKRCAAKAGLPQYGVMGPGLERALRDAGAFDLKANQLLDQYADSVQPKLVAPLQGFDSLTRSLWQAYTLGRNAGLTDLGTHNPASTLPGGGPSDHSVYPAYAFDLGFSPQTGWANLQARAVALKLAGRPEVEYVILGDRIWTDDGRGWHAYTAGNHANHIHCSGHR